MSDKYEIEKLSLQIDVANTKTPQYEINELVQQLILFEKLHDMFETKKSRKCMLSAYLFMTRDFRIQVLKYVGILNSAENIELAAPDIWLRSAKIPPDSEGLGDKGFEHCDRFFAFMNKVRTPKILRNRVVKQYTPPELKLKAVYCKGRHTIETDYSILENVDALKDTIPYNNVFLLPYALEWGHAQMNLQLPLRKPGCNLGLPTDYWI